MIGIYKITNKINGLVYIGQSNNIERRFSEHRYKRDSLVEKAIKKYGVENFIFEIVEECSIDQLNEREKYWIAHYNSYLGEGYNLNPGGNDTKGENNPRAILTPADVKIIRQAYATHQRKKEVFELFKDKISWKNFEHVWEGHTWPNILSEVFTPENKLYYSRQATNGEKSYTAILSDEEVMTIRKRYVKESAKEIWEDYKDRIKYQTLQQILWGRHYKHLPIYKKKEKIWINN